MGFETNNTRSFVVRVIRDKIRVLQVSGAPSWDVRALRQMLKSNPNVDLISFFILRTQDSISLVPNDEMSLIPFPTRELFEQQLPSFDLIILQNFEFRPYGIGDYLENIRSYVEGGGGLAMLGGAVSFSAGGYFGTRTFEDHWVCEYWHAEQRWALADAELDEAPDPLAGIVDFGDMVQTKQALTEAQTKLAGAFEGLGMDKDAACFWQELLALAKAKPESLLFASAGSDRTLTGRTPPRPSSFPPTT